MYGETKAWYIAFIVNVNLPMPFCETLQRESTVYKNIEVNWTTRSLTVSYFM